MAARTSSSVSEVAPDSTGSAPLYSAKARCMTTRTIAYSSSAARRTLRSDDAVGEHLLEQPVGDREGAFAGVGLSGLAPRAQSYESPRRARGQPQQRLDP